MASKVDICNQALANLGKAPIAALDGSSESARQCARFYDRALQSALRDYPWQFARKQAVLALKPETVDGWTYLYSYPSNCAKIRKIYSAENYDLFDDAEYEIFNVDGTQSVACNLESARAEYTAIVVDTTMFDPMFEGCLVYALASELAIPMTGDMKRRQMMLQLYQGAVPVAQASSANERKKQTAYSSRYTTGRW